MTMVGNNVLPASLSEIISRLDNIDEVIESMQSNIADVQGDRKSVV